MSTELSPAPAHPSLTPVVTAVVVGSNADVLGACLAAVRQQVYDVDHVVVVGGDDAVRRVAGEHEAIWRASMAAVLDALGEAEFVWVVRERARPLPDALSALVTDGARADAAIAGSKVLEDGDTSRLVSVGFATDVFDAPYTGLQPEEVDQEQYDVIRDVAAVSGTSMLVRRDLMLGLQGPDSRMAPTAAATDLCQRARLRGGRVAIVPSSEVRYAGPDPTPEWRERAGEIRAMLKVYSPVTLLWAIPLVMITGVMESVIAPFLGRWKLFGVLLAWAWNVVNLPTTIAARVRARRGRVVGDEEIFRYQVGGSARLRLAYDDALERFRTRFPDGVLTGFSGAVEAGQERIRRPSFVLALVAIAVSLIATRSIWGGAMPVSGFSLPPPESAADALGAYAGGWNPAGLGSPEVLRPFVAAVALVQQALLDNAGAAMAVIVVFSFLGGVLGMARLLKVWGLAPAAGYGAGVLLMAGPAVLATGDDGHWVVLVALGAMPWAISGAIRPFPTGWLRRAARMASIVVSTGLVGAFVPGAIALPALMVVVWAALGAGDRWWAALRAVLGLALAAPLLVPWVLFADATTFFETGDPAYWEPGWVLAGIVGLVMIAPLISGDRTVAHVAGWGGIAIAGGTLLARSGDFGLGREAFVTGLVAVGFGTAVAGGAAIEAGARRRDVSGGRLGLAFVGAVATVVLLAGTALVVAPGRAGLTGDTLGGTFAFAAARDDVPTRVLAFGDHLPGTTRDLEGLAYRLVDPPLVRSWSTYLSEPRLGDEALEAVLLEILDGDVRRAGELLAPFGIGWIAFLDQSPMEVLFETQLDLLPLRSFDFAVFRNEVPAGVALDERGVVWTADGTGFVPGGSGAGGRVAVAVNADSHWGPGSWEQLDWANSIAPPGARLSFAPDSARRSQAIAAGAWLLALVGLMAAGWVADRR